MSTHHLDTAADVIAAIGGTKAACALTGRGVTSISNWRVNNRFPAEFVLLMQGELRRLGFEAPSALWGVVQPNERAA